ncbi:MAG: peptide-methionine (R)-S-oxide reductase [Frankiaceae bacterium]|nr:peptide-methionine (R)-S-oxide reductase [Frankiaceae bacterium]
MSTPAPVLALALGRCAVGATVFVVPSVLARGMGVDSVTAERTAWIARLFGVRDVSLGLALLRISHRSSGWLPGRGVDAALREALIFGALCDAGDAVAVVAALRKKSVRPVPALLTVGTALGAAGLGLAVAVR